MGLQLVSDVISIDPVTLGAKGNCGGWAVFKHKRLFKAGFYRHLADLPSSPGAVPVVEIPQVYDYSKSKGNPNQLIRLAFDSARACSAISEADPWQVTPNQWKGQTPKGIVEKRVREALYSTEVLALHCGLDTCRKSWHHNIIEAVGIGLWFIKRFPG